MTDIPHDLVAKIVSAADVSIDTFLAFVKIGAVPKRVIAHPHLQAKLAEIHARRVSRWREKRGDLENVVYEITGALTLTFTVFHGQNYQWMWERRSLTGVARCTHSYNIYIYQQAVVVYGIRNA